MYLALNGDRIKISLGDWEGYVQEITPPRHKTIETFGVFLPDFEDIDFEVFSESIDSRVKMQNALGSGRLPCHVEFPNGEAVWDFNAFLIRFEFNNIGTELECLFSITLRVSGNVTIDGPSDSFVRKPSILSLLQDLIKYLDEQPEEGLDCDCNGEWSDCEDYGVMEKLEEINERTTEDEEEEGSKS